MEEMKHKIISVAIKGIFIVLVPIVILGGVIGAFLTALNNATFDDDSSSGLDGVADLGNYIVKTDEEGAMPSMDKSLLKEAIENSYSGQEQSNMLSVLDDLINVQNEKKVNAAFMIAITHIESSGGTAWANIASWTHNWMSVSYGSAWNGDSGQTYQGHHLWCCYDSFNEAIQKFGIYMTESSHYFKQGKYTVDEIAPTYCNVQWGESIKSELDKIYGSVATAYDGGSAQAVEGDGYTKEYTYAGKTFRLYEQWTGSYAGNTWCGSSIKSGGCGPSSIAIIISGYGIYQNPAQVGANCASRSLGDLVKCFQHYGFNAQAVYHFNKNDETQIINHLKAGNQILLHITQPIVLITGEKAGTTRHYVTLLGINENNDIFVGDPGSGYTDGWTTMDLIRNKSIPEDYILVSK